MSGTPVARPAAFHLSLAALDLPWSDAGRSNEDRVGFGLDADAVVCVWDRCAPPRLTLSRLNDDPTGWPGAANILGVAIAATADGSRDMRDRDGFIAGRAGAVPSASM